MRDSTRRYDSEREMRIERDGEGEGERELGAFRSRRNVNLVGRTPRYFGLSSGHRYCCCYWSRRLIVPVPGKKCSKKKSLKMRKFNCREKCSVM